jgi:hypothetical protein
VRAGAGCRGIRRISELAPVSRALETGADFESFAPRDVAAAFVAELAAQA